MKKLLLASTAVLMATACCTQQQEEIYGYLYCHMSGRGEWTAFAISRDGENWTDLKNGDEVYDTEKLSAIEGGARDAYITRAFDNKSYVMVTTDMCVRKSNHWFNYGIDLLKSDDLINWTSTTFDFRKGPEIFCDPESPDIYTDYSGVNRVWAPQIIWDTNYEWANGEKGGYFIYYSLLHATEEPYDRIYYSYADKSFTKLTKPKVLVDWGYATIDADINFIEADGLYHMMIKKEGGKPGIFSSTAKNITGPYTPPTDDDYISFEGNKKCEGASAFRLANDTTWRVGYVEYSSRPIHYRICKADSRLQNFHDPVDIKGVEHPQHGSFMALTEAEYKRLEAWGLSK
ncbi:MAG: glycoside hydrolase family 43 protein [Bacteroidales bacterium]|nr:glycoside hydrolase family 43 protein [Bacteroidales bacterium]